MDWHDSTLWLVIGFMGNALFFSRFMVQWIASERAGRSYIPTMFWWLSIAGSIVLLLYAVHKRDPVFIIAYLPNCVVYVRNLMLIRKQRRDSAAEPISVPVREPQAADTTGSTDAMASGAPSRTWSLKQ
jgi:lipid-A-disaccharide synthase-like uncharacterized protein